MIWTLVMPEVAILEAFAELPDPRRSSGQRHTQALCLSMFENMAQAQRLCSFGLDILKQLFRMK
ncbi:MAG: hypothetical protein ACYTXY_53105 [Nostoc sp.]